MGAELESIKSFRSPIQSITSPIQTRLAAIKTTESRARQIDAKDAADDEALLAQIGYKQELKRTFSTFQVFGIAYSIMGLLPSISSMTLLGYTSGPAGFLWTWLIDSLGIFSIGLSMSEMASAIPTSGGLYYWSFYYAPEGHKVPISFIVGLSNTVALCAAEVSVAYGNAQEILAAVYMSKDGDFTITSPITYGVFVACVLGCMICTMCSSKSVAALQTTSAVCNTGLIVLFLIVLPIGTKRNVGKFNDAHFIFAEWMNFSDWPIGFTAVLSMLTAGWTIGAFDSCVHMSEEARDASYGVPRGILGSISACAIIGFFIILCTNACVSPSVESILGTDTGFPMAQIIYNALGRNWAIAMMSLMAVCQFLMSCSIQAAASRQIWAFARDGGLPFASFVKVVNKKLKVPLRAVLFCAVLSILLGLLCLAGSTCASALFSLYVSGNYFAWITPIFLRLTYGKNKFVPGVFYLGPTLSKINSWITVLFGVFTIVICMFPTEPTVTASSMNYTVVMTCGTWILSAAWYYFYRYKTFHGPHSNLSPEEELQVEKTLSRVTVQEAVPIKDSASVSDEKQD